MARGRRRTGPVPPGYHGAGPSSEPGTTGGRGATRGPAPDGQEWAELSSALRAALGPPKRVGELYAVLVRVEELLATQPPAGDGYWCLMEIRQAVLTLLEPDCPASTRNDAVQQVYQAIEAMENQFSRRAPAPAN